MDRTIPTNRPHDLLAELFLSTREEKGCSPLTLRNYRLAIQRFVASPHVPADASAITPDHVLLYMADLRRRGLSPANRAWHQRHVFAWLRWLYGRGDIERDPLRGVDPVQVPPVQHQQVTPDDMVRLLTVVLGHVRRDGQPTATRYRDIAILRMLWATGLRRAELVSLDWQDVDMQTMTVTVLGKGQKRRRVPFDAPTKRALLEYAARDRGRDDGPLFLTVRGERMSGDGLRQMLERLERQAGVPVHAHAFRRGFARRMRRSGLDLGETAALMGHSTLVMTRHYSQVGEEEAAIDAYRRLIG